MNSYILSSRDRYDFAFVMTITGDICLCFPNYVNYHGNPQCYNILPHILSHVHVVQSLIIFKTTHPNPKPKTNHI